MKDNYYNSKASVQEYIKLAEGVDGRDLIAKLKNYLQPGASLLELGSGPGTDFQILKKDYKATGSDYSTAFLDHLKSQNSEDNFLHLDAITLACDDNFDGIYSNKVLQHLSDDALKQSIRRQSNILESGGIICHSFWKGEGDEIFKGLLVNYQTEESLRHLFEYSFEVLCLEEYREFDEGDSILLIGKKK